MIIDSIREESRGELHRIIGSVRWEDADRPVQDIYFEVPKRFADLVAPNVETFLVVAVLPAMRLGERRIVIDGQVCPGLYEGILDSMAWLARWNPQHQPTRLDVAQGCMHLCGESTKVAGALLSGGVDALSMLRLNHEHYPAGHRRHIDVGIVARGLWGVEPDSSPDAAERLQRAEDVLRPVTEDAGITLVPVLTNLQNLTDGDVSFWQFEYQGAALASLGHLLSSHLRIVSIASTWDIQHLGHWGSHPVLDHNYGHCDLAVHHEMPRWSRPAKVKLLGNWPEALEVLRVCNRQPEAEFNCGSCEKCLRTMLALLAVGVLDRTRTFEADDVGASDLNGLHVPHTDMEGDYVEVAELLEATGRRDLASTIRRRIRLSRVRRSIGRGRALAKSVDVRVAGGRLSHASYRWRS